MTSLHSPVCMMCAWHGAFPIDTWLASMVEAGGGAR